MPVVTIELLCPFVPMSDAVEHSELFHLGRCPINLAHLSTVLHRGLRHSGVGVASTGYVRWGSWSV